jgi:hypothetical protein
MTAKPTATHAPKRKRSLEERAAALATQIRERDATALLRRAIALIGDDNLNAQLHAQRAVSELRKLTGVPDAEPPSEPTP